MIITNHWSATGPTRLRAYHVEFARKAQLSGSLLHDLRSLAIQPTGFNHVPWMNVFSYFDIWKNETLIQKNDYGTWDNNTDLRDGSANIEVAACCMAGATTDNFGPEPFTIAHAWLVAALDARVAHLKGLDTLESFESAVAPVILQNGPIYVVSTHAERAIQTKNYDIPDGHAKSQALSDEFGYFVGSGDPDSRWDLAILDPEYLLQGQTVSVHQAKYSATWIRLQANAILRQAKENPSGFPGGMLGLDGPETP